MIYLIWMITLIKKLNIESPPNS